MIAAKKERKTKKPERDMNLLNEIKPAGGITFKDVKYITTGSGYEGCIHIYKFPEALTRTGWPRSATLMEQWHWLTYPRITCQKLRKILTSQ